MSRKLKVAVLMGGRSPEHDISLMSGREVAKNLNPKKYQVVPILISRDGQSWQIGSSNKHVFDFPAFKVLPAKNKAKKSIKPLKADLIKDNKIDLAFIAMHGPFGEDGTIQGFLELIAVPYTGSGVLASALGMDKIYSRKLFTQARLSTPKYMVIQKGQDVQKLINKFKLPVFIKPSNQGSSVGTSKVMNKKSFQSALKKAYQYSNLVLAEEFIDGTEVTCAVIGNKMPKALPLVEIVPKTEFFNYKAKYNERLCDEIVPARISKFLAKKAQQAAIAAYKAIGCRGFGRVDMIIKGNNVYVLEVNTIPGLTSVSLFPKAARAAGLTYPQLLDRIIGLTNP